MFALSKPLQILVIMSCLSHELCSLYRNKLIHSFISFLHQAPRTIITWLTDSGSQSLDLPVGCLLILYRVLFSPVCPYLRWLVSTLWFMPNIPVFFFVFFLPFTVLDIVTLFLCCKNVFSLYVCVLCVSKNVETKATIQKDLLIKFDLITFDNTGQNVFIWIKGI